MRDKILKARCNGVALRKESVDRNYIQEGTKNGQNRSLSARRAWIEILCPGDSYIICQSLSARRAWIEILESVYNDIA